MIIRVVSDLHIDINQDKPFGLIKKSQFTIICGDIAGSIRKTTGWLNSNVTNGLFVAGNHMFYDEPRKTVDEIYAEYTKTFPISGNVSFLNNNYKIIDDIVFVGCTLWTDYQLYGKEMSELYKFCALRGMNDYKWGKVKEISEDSETHTPKEIRVPLDPKHCERWFYQSVNYIHEVCKMFPHKRIVVITHHAPSARSLDKRFENSTLNPCFASNLDNFILDHKNIVLWCHGHVHTCCDYMIGDCRVVCNPRGYVSLREKNDFKPNRKLHI